MKKATRILIISALLLLPLQAMAGNDVAGLWKTIDDKNGDLKSIVRIWEENGSLKGRIEKIFPKPGEDPQPKCDKCSGERRNQPIIGMVFLWNFTPDGDNRTVWKNGSIIDPENGKEYHCQLRLTGSGKKLEVFGYIRIIFKIGRTQTWHRAEENDLAAG